MAVIDGGSSSAGKANVTSDYNLQVVTPGRTAAGVVVGGGEAAAGAVATFSENDNGAVTGSRYVLSPETDDDYRLRVAFDTTLDTETFNYTAQNTGKHQYTNTTMTAAWSAAGLTTNSGNITTTTTGLVVSTYAMFPMIGASQLYAETMVSFTAQPTANTIIDFGLMVRGAANPYTPADGVYFRLTSAGLFGVVNSNGTETTTSVMSFTYTNNTVYQFIVATHENDTEFWIDGQLYGRLSTPAANGQPFMSAALSWGIRHAITGGAAGAALSAIVKDYNVSIGGITLADDFGTTSNRSLGSYQGLSGGTMGSLATFANSANPTAAVPTNTTAALGTGLGGQVWETDTLAVTTDGVILSYQIPAGTVNLAGRRLRLNGVKIESFVQTALTGGGYNAVWSLAFGHTAVSLATAEAATTKAPRRIALGNQTVAAGAAALTALSTVQLTLTNPVYVNPGEFVAVVKKKVGTAPSAGVIAHTITYDYSWE